MVPSRLRRDPPLTVRRAVSGVAEREALSPRTRRDESAVVDQERVTATTRLPGRPCCFNSSASAARTSHAGGGGEGCRSEHHRLAGSLSRRQATRPARPSARLFRHSQVCVDVPRPRGRPITPAHTWTTTLRRRGAPPCAPRRPRQSIATSARPRFPPEPTRSAAEAIAPGELDGPAIRCHGVEPTPTRSATRRRDDDVRGPDLPRDDHRTNERHRADHEGHRSPWWRVVPSSETAANSYRSIRAGSAGCSADPQRSGSGLPFCGEERRAGLDCPAARDCSIMRREPHEPTAPLDEEAPAPATAARAA